jgi:hypothetical protein
MRRVLFSQLKVGETYYELYTDSRDKFVGFDGYCAIFKHNVFFAYKKCKFYELIPFKEIVRINRMNDLAQLEPDSNIQIESNKSHQSDQSDESDLSHLGNDALFFQ